MGKQKQKIDTLERRIRALELSNKELILVLKDMVDRLIQSELSEKNKRERESMRLNEDITFAEAKGGILLGEPFRNSDNKKEKEAKNGVQKSGE